jgi:hypothetical protein
MTNTKSILYLQPVRKPSATMTANRNGITEAIVVCNNGSLIILVLMERLAKVKIGKRVMPSVEIRRGFVRYHDIQIVSV